MKNLELSIDREIDFMVKYELTADELFLMKLIWFAQEDRPDYFSDFFSQCELGKPIDELLASLKSKGIINSDYEIPQKGVSILSKIKDIDFNKNVVKTFIQHSQDLGDELFKNYPDYILIQNRLTYLRNLTKNYSNFDDLCWAYGKAIKWNLATHERVMDILEWAKENHVINNNICGFIESRQWESLEKLRDSGEGSYNTYELIN